MNEQCARCQRPMLRTVGPIPDGFVRHQAKGYCVACRQQVTRRYLKAIRPFTYRGCPPAMEVDDVVVHRLLTGDLEVACNAAELWAAITVLDQHGNSARFIAERLGITSTTVHRHRSRTRAVAA